MTAPDQIINPNVASMLLGLDHKQLADLVKKGELACHFTEGGHRRYFLSNVIECCERIKARAELIQQQQAEKKAILDERKARVAEQVNCFNRQKRLKDKNREATVQLNIHIPVKLMDAIDKAVSTALVPKKRFIRQLIERAIGEIE